VLPGGALGGATALADTQAPADAAHAPAGDLAVIEARVQAQTALDVEAREPIGFAIDAVMETETAVGTISAAAEKYKQARLMGFTGDDCSECGSMKMVRNGTCTKCLDCGSTSGCS
jgi:hypothetical protein